MGYQVEYTWHLHFTSLPLQSSICLMAAHCDTCSFTQYKQVSQHTYSVTMRRVSAIIVAVEKQ